MKFSKRILSLFLSLLMVVTSIPVFSIVTNAQENANALTGAYLTNNISDGISGNVNVSWDSNMSAASFSGNGTSVQSYLTLSGNPLQNATDGFTIQFDYYSKGYSGSDGYWSRIFDFGTDTNNYVFMNSSDDNNDGRLRVEFKYNSNTYTFVYYKAKGKVPVLNNEWNNIQLTYQKGVNSIDIYVNGQKITVSPNDNKDISSVDFSGLFSSMTTYYLGKSFYNDPYFNGCLRNVFVFNKSLTYEETLDYPQVVNAKISTGASQSGYSVYSSQDGSVVRTNLVYGDTMKNVLYTYGVGKDSSFTAVKPSNLDDGGIQYGKFVLMYDGAVIPSFVINCYSDGTNSWRRTRRMRYMTPVSDTFELRNYWHGRSTSVGYQTGTGETMGYVQADNPAESAHDDLRYYSNTLYYIGSVDNTTPYISLPGITWQSEDNNGNRATGVHSSSSTQNGEFTAYVVNYKPVHDILSSDSFKSLYQTVSSNENNYSVKTLTEYYTAVKNLLALRVQNYDCSTESGVIALGNKIQEVAEAYNTAQSNLLSYNDYNQFYSAFKQNQVSDLENYTTTTVSKYTENIEKISSVYFPNDWRTTSKTKTDYEQVTVQGFTDASAALKASLNPIANPTDYEVYNNAVSLRDMGIFAGDVQKYTLDSWSTINDAISTVDLTGVGKYTETLTTGNVWNDISYDTYVVDTGTDSEKVAQMKQSLSGLTLIRIDEDTLQTFDSACQVASTIPVSSYDSEYRDATITIVDKLHDEVYTSTDDAESTYGIDVPEGFEGEIVKTVDSLDYSTKKILTQLSGLEENYESFNLTIDGESYLNQKYGTDIELPEKTVPGKWTLTYDNGLTNTIFAPANKLVTVKVENAFTATFTESVSGDDTQTSYRVNVYDGYGRIAKIVYTDSEVTKDNLETLGITPETIPFYDFKEWKVELNSDGKSYTIKPVYVYNVETKYFVKSLGEDFGSYKFDTRIKLEVKDGTTPYGWVNKTADDKYQIVSYKDVFELYVCSDGNYYPFYKNTNGEGYYVQEKDGKINLTYETVYDNILPIGYTAQTENDHLNFKLDNQYPFIYVESVGVASADENKYRVNARFTQQNENKYMAYGVNVRYNENDYKFNCSGKTDTDQFMFTVKIGSAQSEEKIIFMPYINHWFMFGEGENAEKIDAFYYDQADLIVPNEEA